MVISINQQFGLIIFSLVSGMITGVLFDLYRLIRGFNISNKIIPCFEITSVSYYILNPKKLK